MADTLFYGPCLWSGVEGQVGGVWKGRSDGHISLQCGNDPAGRKTNHSKLVISGPSPRHRKRVKGFACFTLSGPSCPSFARFPSLGPSWLLLLALFLNCLFILTERGFQVWHYGWWDLCRHWQMRDVKSDVWLNWTQGLMLGVAVLLTVEWF